MTTTTAPNALWMLNSLLVERATAEQTNGQYSVFEQWITAEGNPPPHVHENEDEAFLVLDGQVDVTVDGVTTRLGPGGFAFAPRGLPHTYAIVEGMAHLIMIATPGGIEHFFRELGEPAGSMALPVPAAPDVEKVVGTAARHAMTILPPA